MKRQSILLIGAGGHCRSCIDVIEQEGRWDIVGLVGQKAEIGASVLGYKVIANDAELADLAKDYRHILITVGHIQTPNLRAQLFYDARRLGFTLPVVVSPRAYVSRHASIGDGTVVFHGAIVNAGARVGMNCIVNSRALVEHDVAVGDHCHISTGAILNGDVRVGAFSFVGSASVVKQGLALGEHSFLGMGIALKRDLDAHSRLTTEDNT
jgi:sugar O-acyltransferase (sialic acid O-acetyltransferase NeuD family)